MGGFGTRLGKETADRPKALVIVNGIPFFDYQLKILKNWGFRKYLFLVGYQARQIEEYYGSGWEQGIDIQYSYDGERQLGTGGALRKAMDLLEEHFVLIYGDSFMDINYFETLYRFYEARKTGSVGLMCIYKNKNQYDKSNVVFKNGELILYDKKNTKPEMNYIDYGVSLLSKEMLTEYKLDMPFDLSDSLTRLSKQGKLAAQIVTKRFYEIGRPETLEEFRKYAFDRFETPRKAVFLDRDGVINQLFFHEETEQLDSPFCPEQFEYINGAVKALERIREKGYYIFIVTNQPAAAKGKVRLTKLYDLNTWLLQDLNDRGIAIERINMCPHHPTGAGFSKDSFLIRTCGCRKPGAGLITEMDKFYSIDWEHTYMAGDSYTDVQAGRNAGVKTAFIGSYKCDICSRLNFDKPDFIVETLEEFAEILK